MPTSPELNNKALEAIQLCNDRVEEIIDSPIWNHPIPKFSTLAADDEAFHYSTVSQLCIRLDSIATDHLRTFKSIFQSGSIPTYSCMTLIRPVIECTGLATWVLGPKDRDERLLRYYAFIKSKERHADNALSGLIEPAGREISRNFVDKLDAALNEREEKKSVSLKRNSTKYTTTSSLKYTDEQGHLFPNNRPSGLSAWRMCSATSHANPMALPLLTENSIVISSDNKNVSEVTQSMPVLAYTITTAVAYIEAFRRLYYQRAQAIF